MRGWGHEDHVKYMLQERSGRSSCVARSTKTSKRIGSALFLFRRPERKDVPTVVDGIAVSRLTIVSIRELQKGSMTR